MLKKVHIKDRLDSLPFISLPQTPNRNPLLHQHSPFQLLNLPMWESLQNMTNSCRMVCGTRRVTDSYRNYIWGLVLQEKRTQITCKLSTSPWWAWGENLRGFSLSSTNMFTCLPLLEYKDTQDKISQLKTLLLFLTLVKCCKCVDAN